MITDEKVLNAIKNEMAKYPMEKPKDDSPLYDKIKWLNYSDLTEDRITCVDKVKVKEFVRSKVGDRISFAKTLQILGPGTDPGSIYNIDLKSLPQKFLIKKNNACQKMLFCWDKNTFDVEDAKHRIEKWGSGIPGLFSHEYQYCLVEPLLFVEELLTASKNDDLTDYRFWCMNNKVKFVALNKGRGMGRQYFVDTDFKRVDIFNSAHSTIDDRSFPFSKPDNFKGMVALAEELSAPFKFVRLDMYNIKGKPYLGEFTFSPSGYTGHLTDSSGRILDVELGKQLKL